MEKASKKTLSCDGELIMFMVNKQCFEYFHTYLVPSAEICFRNVSNQIQKSWMEFLTRPSKQTQKINQEHLLVI